jgi:hypothetical protein
MNWDRVQGYWQQVTGKVQEAMGELIDNDRPPPGNTRRVMLETMAAVLVVFSLLAQVT